MNTYHKIKLNFFFLFSLLIFGLQLSAQDRAVDLTQEEKEWISNHPVLNVGNERFWPPIDFAIDGKAMGFGIDLMDLIGKELGLEINYINGLSWEELMDALDQGKIDVLPAISKTKEREAYIKFSRSYINLPYVKVINSANSANETFKFEDKVLAVNKGSNIAIAALNAYPKLDTIHINTLLEGMQKVSTGEADVFIENLGLVSYYMNESYIPNIKLISDNLDFLESSTVQMGVLKKNKILGNLIDKGINAISNEDINALRQKWLPIDTSTNKEEVFYKSSNLWKILISIVLLFSIFYFVFKWVFKRFIKEKIALEFGSRKFRVKTKFYLTILVIVIAAMGWLAITYIESEFSENIKLQLQNDLKSANGRLDFWLNQKKDYLKSLGHDQKLVDLTTELVEVSNNYNERQYNAVHNKLAQFFKEHNYQGSFIINQQGHNIGSVDKNFVGNLNSITKSRPELVKKVFAGKVVFVPPLLTKNDELDNTQDENSSLMHFLIPVEDVDHHVIAAIIQEINPELGFSEILQLSHVGETGESYIFNHKGRMLSKSRFENDLKSLGVFQLDSSGVVSLYIKDPGGNLTTGFRSEVPIDQRFLTLMAKSAVEGNSGVNIEGYNDYRGVPVMGAWTWIDKLELGLATEIDVDEALNLFYFIRLSAMIVLGLTLLIIIGSILFTLTLGEKANVALIKAKDELEERVEIRTTELDNEKSLLGSLINAIPDLIFYKDTNYKFLGANKAFEKQIGFKKGEIIGKKDTDFIPEELAEKFEKSDALILEKSESVSMESEDVDPDGNKIVFDTKKTPFFNEQGKLLGLIGISRDITERKKAELRVKSQSAALKSAANGVVITNTKGKIVWINPAFTKLTGYNWREVVGKTPRILNSGKHDKQFYSKMWNTILGGKTWQGEIINKKKNGELFYEEMTITPIIDDKGELTQFVAIKNDITERKKAEEEIRASENKFRSITSSATDAIVSANKKGVIESWNTAAEKIFGYTEQEAIGQKLEIIIPSKYQDSHQIGINRVLGGGEKKAIGRVVELEGLHKNGEIFPVELALSVFDGKDGMNFSGIIRDITERKKVEEILLKAKERMEDELNVAKDIQMSMLPLIFPAYPKRDEVDIYAELIPAREVGGDFYDFHFIDENHLCFVMADVSGKGVPAALMMAVTKTLLKSRASNDKSPASILTDVNNEIAKDNDSYMFITVFLAILNTNTGELIYSNAGHNPSYIISKENKELIKLGDLHGPVIGAMEGMTYGETKLLLKKNDIVFSYTDGVTESHNINAELYSDPRLEDLLHNGDYDSTKSLTKLVIQSVKDFEGDAEQFDDITAMAIEYCQNPNTISSIISSTKIKNDLKQIATAIEWFEAFALENKMPFAIIQKINIAFDELLNNIISYGYDDEDVHEIDVEIELRSERLIIIIRDDGIPFNPFEKNPPDTMLSVEERMIGGLGIHLVKKLMDEYEYKRHTNKNIITLIKHNINT